MGGRGILSVLAIATVLSSCKPPAAAPPAPPAPAAQPPAGPVSREADPEPDGEMLGGDEAVVPPELQQIDGAIGGYAWVPAGEVLEGVKKARESREISFIGPLFLLGRNKAPEVAAVAREALADILSGIRAAPAASGATEPSTGALEVTLVERVRIGEKSRYFNIRKAIREELAKASVVVVRPDAPPPPLLLIVDYQESSGSAKYVEEQFSVAGLVADTSVLLLLRVWIVDTRGPRVLGWFAADAEARPLKVRERSLHLLSVDELKKSIASDLGAYVLAASGRRSEFGRLLVKSGLTDELRTLAGSMGYKPEGPEEEARFLMADRRYRDCARLGKAGLDVLLPVYRELSYRDDSQPEYEVAEAIASADGPDVAPALRDMVIHFPVGTLLDTAYLRIDPKTAVLLLGRLAEVGDAEDARIVAPWTDAKWSPEVSEAARRAKAALEAKRR